MNNKKHQRRAISVISVIFITIVAVFVSTNPALAQVDTSSYDIMLGNTSPLDVAVNIINWGLGILALVAVVICLYGGFMWLFSQGEEEKIEKAKKILKNGLIGLVIILASWAIAYYLINKFYDITSGGDGAGGTPGSYTYPNGNPFYVDHTNPQDGESDVSLCHLVAATFSLPIQEESITEDTFKVTLTGSDMKSDGDGCAADDECKSASCLESNCVGDQVAGTYNFAEDPSYVAVWYPTVDYLPNKTYRVELTTEITGIDEITVDTYNLDTGDAKRIFEFTTGTTTDEIPPKVRIDTITPYPSDGETDVCRNTAIQSTFDESMDPTSFKDENIRIYNYYDDTTTPSDELDTGRIRNTSIGGNADDTFVTTPEDTLEAYSLYGLSLYSGAYDDTAQAVRDNFDGAIKDTCGNPLSGNFDDNMEGSPTDDFIETTSAGGADWEYQWTFETGEEVNCIPVINSVSYEVPAYYSEDNDPYDTTGSEDSNLVTVKGDYLYPFYDVDFFNNISAAGMNCFDTSHTANMSCFVSNVGSQEIVVRTTVAAQTGRISVENESGSDSSSDTIIVESPYIRNLSADEGPVGQFVTVQGKNFGDYDPSVEGSTKGEVYFDDILAETPCADGWDDDQIIVKVPEGFAVEDFPKVQVITAASKYSNERGFVINNEEPGPGQCVLDPDCSDTGDDDVYSVGQNYGTDEGEIYFVKGSNETSANIQSWNIEYADDYTYYHGYESVLTDQLPGLAQDSYNVYAEDVDGNFSNGLNFDLPCQEPPELFFYSGCDLENTFYLPNPKPYNEEACPNGAMLFAFTDDMDNSSVAASLKMYDCGSGEDYISDNCTTEVSGGWVSEMLNMAYLDGSETETSGYEGFEFTPSANLTGGNWYKVSVPEDIYSSTGVNIAQGYEWHIKVRDTGDCSVDIVDMRPAYQRITEYDSANPVPYNYEYEDSEYSYKASPYNSDCYALRSDFNWHWQINDYDNDNILRFSSDTTSQDTSIGYNNVYLQGEGEDNFGTSYVAAGPTSSTGSYPALSSGGIEYEAGWVYDNGKVDVDFGYCTSDSDCAVEGCEGSTCDLTTNHCTPIINSFSPATAGPGGCASVNGCYFGSSRQGKGLCSCTGSDGTTCDVSLGYSSCLLSSSSSCDLGVTCDATNASYYLPGSGKLEFNSSEGGYLSETLCGQTWINNQIISEIPLTLSAGDYTLNVTSYYGLQTSSSDTITIGTATTPCLCKADPDSASEGSAITLYGKNFDVLDTTSRLAKFADFTRSLTSTATWTDLGSDEWSAATSVAQGATSDDYNGIKVTDGSLESNAIGFKISCSYDSDCSTRCCSEGVCAEAGECNRCEDKTDCSEGSCLSDCVDGMCTPYVTKIKPDYGNVGQPITVHGCHFGSYYPSTTYSPYSSVMLNGVEAEMACDETDTWNNKEIKILAPEGIFDDSEEAEVSVQQVYRETDGTYKSQDSGSAQAYCENATCDNETDCEALSVDGGCDSVWNKTVFNLSDLCTYFDIPVLCRINPANGTYSDTTYLEGENFTSVEPTAYCTCENDYGSCNIDEGGSTCTIDYSYDCYADPDDSTVQCSSILNVGGNYYMEDGCLEDPFYENETDCVAAGNTWDTIDKCRCVNSDNLYETCWIEDGSEYCTFTPPAEDLECSVPGYDATSSDPETCGEDTSGYTDQNGRVEFANGEEADWQYNPDASYDPAPYSIYLKAIVPETAETGNVYVQAIQTDGTVCGSNGVNYDITCDNCSECADNMMCNLTEGEGSFGVCTSSITGYCEDYPDSCCGNTGCRAAILETCELGYDCTDSSCLCESTDSSGYCSVASGGNSCSITDGGGCYERPLIDDTGSAPAQGATDVCPNAEISLTFDGKINTSNTYGTEDDADFSDYVKLVSADSYSFGTSFSAVTADEDIIVTRQGESSLLLTQSSLLENGKTYYIVVYSNPDDNTGIIKNDTGVSLGCDDDQEGIMCTSGGDTFSLSFTVGSSGDFDGGCEPSYVDLEGDDDDFVSANYTFISEEEDQNFIARVYYSADGVRGNDDDQAIAGISGVLDWDYDWYPTYDSIEDMEASSCPVVGIITDADQGYCPCNVGQCVYTAEQEACEMTLGQPYCTITTYDTEYCYFDPTDTTAECDAATCSCTLDEESCTAAYGETSCDLDQRGITLSDSNATCETEDSSDDNDECNVVYDPDVTDEATCLTDNEDVCTLDSDCNPENTGFIEGDFTENESTQVATSDSQEGEGWVSVAITGDGSTDHGWSGTYDDSQFVRVLFCDNYDYLYSFSDTGYLNAYFAYCRGDDADNLLPTLDAEPTEVSGSATGDDFLYEYLFTNDTNDDLVGVIVYNNGLDGFSSTYYDVAAPGTWADLRLDNFGEYSNTTIDDYEAVETNYNVLVSAPNLYDDGSTQTLYPNIYMLSVNKNADEDTLQVLEKLKSTWSFNTNDEFAPEPGAYVGEEDPGCQVKKDKLIRDTKRLTDIGTMNFLMAKYYYLGGETYPSLSEGSYIQNYSTSLWPSWNSALGNALGLSMYEDPVNEFDDATANCPYSEDDSTYYDETGTCWDPINKDYKCPVDSHIYQYIGDNDGASYNFYANFELDDESWDWDDDTTHDPCSGNEYSDSGCGCFNYQSSSSSLSGFYNGTCDTSNNVCNSDSGFLENSYCTADSDCQIVSQ